MMVCVYWAERATPLASSRLADRYIRLEKVLTIEALTATAGLDKGFLSRLERGTKRPSLATALQLSAALNVAVGLLFGEQTTDETVRSVMPPAGSGRSKTQGTTALSCSLRRVASWKHSFSTWAPNQLATGSSMMEGRCSLSSPARWRCGHHRSYVLEVAIAPSLQGTLWIKCAGSEPKRRPP